MYYKTVERTTYVFICYPGIYLGFDYLPILAREMTQRWWGKMGEKIKMHNTYPWKEKKYQEWEDCCEGISDAEDNGRKSVGYLQIR